MSKPKCGDGATVRIGSDSYACTIIAVFDLKGGSFGVKVQQDKATPAEGHDHYGVQKYTYAPNPKGETHMFRHDVKLNRWRESIFSKKTDRLVWATHDTYRLSLAERRTRIDPSF